VHISHIFLFVLFACLAVLFYTRSDEFFIHLNQPGGKAVLAWVIILTGFVFWRLRAARV
jgi:hypothetical protein